MREAEKRAWNPSDLPDWLNEDAYRKKIQPRLLETTVPAISSVLNVSDRMLQVAERASDNHIHGIGWRWQGWLECKWPAVYFTLVE